MLTSSCMWCHTSSKVMSSKVLTYFGDIFTHISNSGFQAVEYPHRRFQILLRSTMGPIDVYLVRFEAYLAIVSFLTVVILFAFGIINHTHTWTGIFTHDKSPSMISFSRINGPHLLWPVQILAGTLYVLWVSNVIHHRIWYNLSLTAALKESLRKCPPLRCQWRLDNPTTTPQPLLQLPPRVIKEIWLMYQKQALSCQNWAPVSVVRRQLLKALNPQALTLTLWVGLWE